MPMIKIDNVEYDTERLWETAKAQLVNLQVVDQKIAAKQQEVEIQQTARNAYAQSLKDALSAQLKAQVECKFLSCTHFRRQQFCSISQKAVNAAPVSKK